MMQIVLLVEVVEWSCNDWQEEIKSKVSRRESSSSEE